MRRTPYSPFVENETAPEPWYTGRVAIVVVTSAVRVGASISE
jgi:hypothetical protein